MDAQTTGFVLRTRPLTETSLIVQWLTPDFGRLSTVAKGARRPKSPFAGKLDLFYLADLSFHQSQRSDLHSLREVNVREYFSRLRQDLVALQQAAYFVQLLEQATETDTPLPGFYELFQEALQAIEGSALGPVAVLAFETKLLIELGLHPALAGGSRAANTRPLLEQLEAQPWTALPHLSIASVQLAEIDHALRRCLLEQFGRLAKARPLALAAVR